MYNVYIYIHSLYLPLPCDDVFNKYIIYLKLRTTYVWLFKHIVHKYKTIELN